MDLIVNQTSKLSGRVGIPSSKSQNVRALIFALMAKGSSTIINTLESDDTTDARQVVQALGAQLTRKDHKITVQSEGLPFNNHISSLQSGNSGITTLFTLPLLGYRGDNPESIIYDCGEQMRARPIFPLVDALNNLGLKIEYLNKTGHCPVRVSGRLQGGQIHLEGSSSQYLSALLISLPCAELDSEIIVDALQERPYALMTLRWLEEQKIQYHHEAHGNTDIFTIPGRQTYRSFQKILTGDFSSASYLIAAGVLLNGQIELTGLDMNDPQGDKKLVNILQEMGADISIQPNSLIICGGKPLRGITIDANDIPDLLPTLAVIGSQAKGKTAIFNVKHARVKETDRIHSMTQGLIGLGARIDEYADGITVYQSTLKGNQVKGYGDHRTVMALALAGLLSEGVTTIDQAQAINKTFPTFVELMKSLGAQMRVSTDE